MNILFSYSIISLYLMEIESKTIACHAPLFPVYHLFCEEKYHTLPETTAWGLSYIACSTHYLQPDECNTHRNDNLTTCIACMKITERWVQFHPAVSAVSSVHT